MHVFCVFVRIHRSGNDKGLSLYDLTGCCLSIDDSWY